MLTFSDWFFGMIIIFLLFCCCFWATCVPSTFLTLAGNDLPGQAHDHITLLVLVHAGTRKFTKDRWSTVSFWLLLLLSYGTRQKTPATVIGFPEKRMENWSLETQKKTHISHTRVSIEASVVTGNLYACPMRDDISSCRHIRVSELRRKHILFYGGWWYPWENTCLTHTRFQVLVFLAGRNTSAIPR